MEISDYIQYITGIIGGFVGWFLGGFDIFLILLTVFVVIDYVSGVIAATCNGKLSSSVGFRGIAKKVFIFFLVGMAHILDVSVMGQGAMLRTAVIFFYAANEGLSIIENCALMNLPVPEVLKKALAKLGNSGDKKDED